MHRREYHRLTITTFNAIFERQNQIWSLVKVYFRYHYLLLQVEILTKFLSARKKKNLSVHVHPRANSAYEFFHSQAFLFDKTAFGSGTIEALHYGQFFSATHPSPTKCYLFSGFEIPGFSIHQFEVNKHNVIIFDELSDDDIELSAWAGVFRVLLSSTQPSQLEPLRKAINTTAPKIIIEKLFSCKKITQQFLANCTYLTVSGLKKQKPPSSISPRLPTQPKGSLSIFEQLVNQANDES